jgi:hypothetical protein
MRHGESERDTRLIVEKDFIGRPSTIQLTPRRALGFGSTFVAFQGSKNLCGNIL